MAGLSGLLTTLLLFLSWNSAHSQDCNSYVNITGSGLERLETGTNVCFICFFDGPGVIDTGTQWTIGNPAQAIPSGDGSVIDGVLIIFNLTTVFDQNLMFLLCEAGDGSVYETAISLSIFVPPTIDGLTVVNETDTLMLLCDTSQSAPVPSPSWLDPNGTEVSTVTSLVIENMDRSQAGLYTCVIMQSSNELSTNVTVTVQHAPDVNTTVSSPHLSPRGQPLSLSCDYDSVPPPDITWLFEGTTLLDSDPRVTILSTETHSDCTLNGLMESEAGLYSCRAGNLLGMNSVEITVTVQVPPDPPSALEVTDQTTTTLSLQWTNRGDGLSPITGIEIEYQIQGTGGGVTETISEVVEEFTLENLVPFSTYDIQVFVVNAVERSEPNTTTGTTDSLPLPAPIITRFVAESSTELRLEWELPAFDSATISPVVSWVVEYGRESSSDAMKDVLGNVTSLLIPELEKGVEFTAKVAGRNERRSGVVQLGGFSNTATNQTDVDRILPLVLMISGPNSPVISGNTITLICSYSNDSFLSNDIVWSREGTEELPENSITAENVLVLVDPQPGDSGVYICMAGGDTATFTLEITDEVIESGTGGSSSVAAIAGSAGGVAVVLILSLLITVVIVAGVTIVQRRRKYDLDRGTVEVWHGQTAFDLRSAQTPPPEYATVEDDTHHEYDYIPASVAPITMQENTAYAGHCPVEHNPAYAGTVAR